ncbi:hypothetical protein B0H34DRAFT_810561 [Crassisporium funariophilum]|nr:hypothetical protein B0H34DRAFT_810561 [Crassisporium funariophilum]
MIQSRGLVFSVGSRTQGAFTRAECWCGAWLWWAPLYQVLVCSPVDARLESLSERRCMDVNEGGEIRQQNNFNVGYQKVLTCTTHPAVRTRGGSRKLEMPLDLEKVGVHSTTTHGSENNDDKESDDIFGPPGKSYTSLVFDLEFPDISAARRAHFKFKIYSISFTKHLPSSPRKSDLRFGCPGNAFTSPVFDLEFPDISAARRAHFKIKLPFVDIGQLTQVDGVKEEARKARRRRRCSRQV